MTTGQTKPTKIKEFFGVDSQEIEKKEHNIWIGISFSNKEFTKEKIVQMVELALLHTKEKVLVLVPGRMHATNYRYFDGMRRSEALRKAFEDEDEVCTFLEQHTFSEGVEISNYDGVCTPKHIQQREVVFREFAKQNFFYDEVMNIVGSLVISRGRTRDVAREESLALYVLHELPFFIDGVQKMDNSRQYTVNMYPGKSDIDYLAQAIRSEERFNDLRNLLNIENKTGLIVTE